MCVYWVYMCEVCKCSYICKIYVISINNLFFVISYGLKMQITVLRNHLVITKVFVQDIKKVSEKRIVA